MNRLFAVCAGLLLSTTVARASDVGSGSHRADTSRKRDSCGPRTGNGLTLGPDPFRAGDQVVRDRDTGRPLYRVEPDPFHPGWQRLDDYNTGQPLGEARPNPFNVDQSEVDPR